MLVMGIILLVSMDRRPTFQIPESQLIQSDHLDTASQIKPDKVDTQPILNKLILGNQESPKARAKAKVQRVEEERVLVMKDQKIGSNM
jgi:hypothetical protein